MKFPNAPSMECAVLKWPTASINRFATNRNRYKVVRQEELLSLYYHRTTCKLTAYVHNTYTPFMTTSRLSGISSSSLWSECLVALSIRTYVRAAHYVVVDRELLAALHPNLVKRSLSHKLFHCGGRLQPHPLGFIKRFTCHFCLT